MAITFRGKHSYRDMHVRTAIRDRPITPPKKTKYVDDVPYMDGSIDFTEAGGRAYYSDKILEIDFMLICPDVRERNRRIEQFISWINGGPGELIIDDMPSTVWTATPVEVEDMGVKLRRMGKTTVEFRCEPYNRFICDTRGIPLGTPIEIGRDIPLGWGEEFRKEISGAAAFTITNAGTVPVRPLIHITGAFQNISISGGENTLKYNASFTSLILDCTKFAAFINGESVTENAEGEFFELMPGDNEIKVDCDGKGEIFFEFTPMYFYDETLGVTG